jgi:hypothetical protein
MKHIKTFESFLFEFKQVGPLYHFTTLDALEGILEEDRMEPSAMYDYVSFTRNPLLHLHRRNVRIDFDGDEMSNKFSFEPFLYDPEKDPNFYDPEHVDYKQRRELYGEEREERVKMKEMKGIKKFINVIEILQESSNDPRDKKNQLLRHEKLAKMQKDNPDIEFRIVKSFSTRSKNRYLQAA